MKTMVMDIVPDPVVGLRFFAVLRASGLLPPDEVDELERRAANVLLPDLLAELVESGRLTEYQLTCLQLGKPGMLLLGKYRVLRQLGEGGFGRVLLAYHTLMQRPVAVKMLGEHLADDPSVRALFRREVVTTTRLVHPNIATAFDAGECDGQLYLVMEYVDGPTLEAHVARHGPVSPPFAVTLLAQAVAALGYAAECGFVHRDIKPANLILSGPLPTGPHDPGREAVLKVLDFGLARVPAGGAGSVCGTLPCGAGGTVGTPAYMPPEQIGDPHTADVRSDLYSLGCSLFFALTGKLPFAGRSIAETFRMHLSDPTPDVRLLRPSVPAPLADIVRVLMAKDPADRFQTPADLLAVLAAHTPGVPSPPAPLPPPGTPEPPLAPPPAWAFPPVAPVMRADKPAGDFVPLWREWFTTLKRVACGEEPELTDHEYRALYSDLIAAASVCSTPDWMGLAQRLVAAVEPWVNLRSLAELDRRMLVSVRQACAAIDADLRPTVPDRTKKRWWWFAAVLGGGLAGAALRMAM